MFYFASSQEPGMNQAERTEGSSPTVRSAVGYFVEAELVSPWDDPVKNQSSRGRRGMEVSRMPPALTSTASTDGSEQSVALIHRRQSSRSNSSVGS